MWKESKQLQLLDYDRLSRSALYITLETEMKAQSNECRSGQKIVFNEQQLKITIKTLEKSVLSAFLWELDHSLLLFSICKLSNGGISGTPTKSTNYIKQGVIASCVEPYPFCFVLYMVFRCSAQQSASNGISQYFIHSHATSSNLQTTNPLFTMSFIH